MAIMTDKRIHLPALENQKFVGIGSIEDQVKSIIADQKSTIEQPDF